LTLRTKIRYHIQTDGQHQMLIDKYGLTAKDPYNFTVYEQAVPLTGNLTNAFNQSTLRTGLACATPNRG
jgi:hypothetical protein